MEQIRTARKELAYIQNVFFKRTGLARASLLEGEERRAYKLAQVERLLAVMHGGAPLAVYLSDMFWTADEGRVQYDVNPSPLLSLKEQQTLTDKEMRRLRLILEIAGLCHDLSLHFTFDLTEAFGIKGNNKRGMGDFWVSNKPLVEWLTTTEYEHIAKYTVYIMKKFAINVYADSHYLPAQDELAQLFSAEHQCRLDYPERTEIPPRGYVNEILDALLRIERHWQRGMKLKLDPEVVILHDEIYGFIPRQFDKRVLQAAQELFDYMDSELCGRLAVKGYDEYLGWDEQPESVRRNADEVMGRFIDKVREVRSSLGENWLADYSLEINYIVDHANRCGLGSWRMEDVEL